jgi:hypothetical protein
METSSTLDRQQSSTTASLPGGERAGVVPGLVGAGVDLAGAGVRTTFGLFGEVRGQTTAIATQTIDFAEQIVHGLCELGRRSARRIDQAFGEAAGAMERVALSALGAVRSSGEQAAHLAMSVAENAVGPRRGNGN